MVSDIQILTFILNSDIIACEGDKMTNFDPRSAPLAEIEELGELKRRYGIYDSATLRRWAAAVTGSHRRAMEELLQERGEEGL